VISADNGFQKEVSSSILSFY